MYLCGKEQVMATKKCNQCGMTIPVQAKICPFCGANVKNGSMEQEGFLGWLIHKAFKIFIIAILVLVIIAFFTSK